jgi:putative Ca2+/H+ antiporter (TMEM165/GDT1 family)
MVFGIKAYKTGETAKLILHESRKVPKWIFSVLMVLLLIVGIIDNLPSMLAFDAIWYLFAAISMIVYLLSHQGKKPSFLFSATAICTGCACILIPLGNSIDMYSLYLATDDALFAKVVIIPLILQIICAVLNILIGFLIYREKFSVPMIKVLGWCAFLLFLISKMDSIFDSHIYIDFFSISYLLQSAIFVYTCFVPMRTKQQ